MRLALATAAKTIDLQLILHDESDDVITTWDRCFSLFTSFEDKTTKKATNR